MPKKNKKKKPSERRAERYQRREQAEQREVQKEQVLEDLRGVDLDDQDLAVLKALAPHAPEEDDSEDETGEVEIGDEVADPESPEEIQKDYGSTSMGAPTYIQTSGPTSFDELDTAREAEEKAYEVRMAGWDVQDLVRNIIHHPGMKPKEKSAAITKVGKDFESRVADLMTQPVQKDLDVLTIEAILARDKRRMGPVDRLLQIVSKGKSRSEKDSVRQSLADVAQLITRGGEEGELARVQLPKLRERAKALGIEVSMDKDKNAIVVEKDQSGNWRWVGWASNNFMDYSGEILTEAAHLEYVAWLDKNKDMAPLLMSWHTPGTAREKPADFWMYENGFLILSGPLTEGEAAGLLKAQALTDLGMSVGGFAFANPATPNEFTRYRLYEVSDLPLKNADNPFTDFAVLVKEADMDKAQYLATLIGEERATEFLQKTGLKAEALKDAGVKQKEKEVETTTPEAKPGAKPQAKQTVTPEMEVILKAVEKRLDIEGLNEFIAVAKESIEKVPVLEELVKELAASRDESLAEMIEPRHAWSRKIKKQTASESADTEVSDEDPVAKAIPELGDDWLSKATGTKAIDVEKVAS